MEMRRRRTRKQKSRIAEDEPGPVNPGQCCARQSPWARLSRGCRNAPARDLQDMSLLSLSPELIEGIALFLPARDISSFSLTCKRFHDIVGGSLILQYTYRTEIAGVYDPLRDLSRRSIVDRIKSLSRWEASWNDLGRHLSAAPPRLVIPAERALFGPFFLRDDYLFAVHWQGHPAGPHQPALLYVDLRDALCTGQHSWRKIDYPKGSIAITQAFSIEEDDLVVSVLR